MVIFGLILIFIILGIILWIGTHDPTIGNYDFDFVAKQLINDAAKSPGAIYPSSGEFNFQKDSIYPQEIFASVSGGREISFECEEDLPCTGGNELTISEDFREKIYVCCLDEPAECYVGIGYVNKNFCFNPRLG